MHKKTTLLIVDDHRVVIAGIRSLLAPKADIEIVGEATDGAEAVALSRELAPDIVIMDISMPEMDGVEATGLIRQVSPRTRIIIYTMHSDQRFILELFKAGISGHVLKEGPPADLCAAVEAVMAGKTYFTTIDPAALLRQLSPERSGREDLFDHLSPRELEVFRLLADGLTVKEAAAELHISPKTVETHKYNLMEKLEVGTIPDLTKLAIRHGLISV
ncbi:two component transcriptional regulator, LuxR family [Pseudodesulfovibrio mercurii]|uniref:Two component transcriptional regulator, LuxR family n=1 Tax=Pseudodesulfovibrio mercurii TaxID=641491 RepID=F0JK68_9BACT|nr:response regulator transcription factor [Pseudodesulfovibrio mercurii]EGB16317.1 two component transcriptional regulator, LuxR family [Pseudodesulfovibrio mercurii]